MEPQDASNSRSSNRLLVQKQMEANEAIVEMNKRMPQSFNMEAERAIGEAEAFRADILSDVDAMLQLQNQIHAKLDANMHNAMDQRGFLLKQPEVYKNCFRVDRMAFVQLLDENEARWRITMQQS